MAKIAEDLSGSSFNYWKIISYSHSVGYQRYYNCECICGNKKVVCGKSIKQGQSKSCCWIGFQPGVKTHGEANKSREYVAWQAMKYRCLFPSCKAYKNYGGRGITVCDRWKHSFENFLSDMGRKPTNKNSLDRYPNNNGNYEPGNCRWATMQQQACNTRGNCIFEYNGISMSQGNWCRVIGIHRDTLRVGSKKGKTLEYYIRRKNISNERIINYFNSVYNIV